MSMYKIISPGDQDFGEPIAQQIKIAARGLMGDDLLSFIKRAGSPVLKILNDIDFHKDEIPIHLIALGATEAFGPNRNFDGFKEAACIKYHNTFEKNARFYRNHQNKDKSKSYGIIKASFYNPVMKRIELIVALNGSKQAADRNGGLIADKEMEKLASGQDLAVSMACRVLFDVCSFCGHHAKNRTEYCLGMNEGGFCKAGGLRNHIGRMLEDGHILHADNTEPDFFDISNVHKPADRTAYVFGKLK